MTHDPFAITQDGSSPQHAQEMELVELSNNYLRALESGEKPDRELFLARCPNQRALAIECLDGVELAFSIQKNSRNLCETRRTDPLHTEPLGDFRILSEIGRGGMGVVYEAVQLSLARNVALKVLPFAAALDERHRKRFLVEAQSAAQLHHPNIVPVYAVGCERGTHFYAMQLIHGRPVSSALFDEIANSNGNSVPNSSGLNSTLRAEATLRDDALRSSMRSRTLDRNRIIASLIAQVADALEYAHSCGIVHRDVKPGNLLLDTHGKIWITDFGLAQIATSDHMTQTGDMVGTLRYMSPEQASGHPGVIDHRSDVYSLGATLYEMLARRPVFEGNNRQELLNKILNAEPISLRKIDRLIPEELEIITLKAIRQSPSDRYDLAKDFAEDLRRFLNENPILARRPTLIDKTRKWMRRHPSTVLSLLFALIAAVLSLAVVTVTVTTQKSLTEASFQREKQRFSQAERRLSIAQSAADEMIQMAERELSISPMEEALRQRLLTSAIRYYQSLIDETTEDEETQQRLLTIRNRAESILRELSLVRGYRELLLLQDPKVQKDLGLSQEQLDLLVAKDPLDYKPGNKEFVEYALGREEIATKVLTIVQRERLKQIAIQRQGPPGLRDIVVSGKLELTSDQMHAIQSDIIAYVTQIQAAGGMGDELFSGIAFEATSGSFNKTTQQTNATIQTPEDLMSPELRSALLKVILERLNPEQLARWKEMTGELLE
jgi:serine/threonine protein kinase